MKLKNFFLSLVFVFSTLQAAPLAPSAPIPPDDTKTEIIANMIKNSIVGIFTLITNPKTIPTALFNATVLPVWQGAKADPLPALLIGGTFAYLCYKRIQAHKLAVASDTFFRNNPASLQNIPAVPIIQTRANQLRIPWYLGGGWLF